MPERVQLSRRRGYRKPEGAVVVARPSRWGNPFRVVPADGGWFVEIEGIRVNGVRPAKAWSIDRAVALFRDCLESEEVWSRYPTVDEIRAELAGKDLACWCPLPAPGKPDTCHAAVLLELASQGDR